MQKNKPGESADIFGTFLKKSPQSQKLAPAQSEMPQSESDPAGEILTYLKEHGESSLREMLKTLGGNTKLYLDTIQQLEGFGLVVRDKNDQGRPTIKLT